MEDFIYIIALIAWVVFSFYRKQQKKAEADRQLKRRAPVEIDPEPAPTWTDIFMGEEDEPENEPVPVTVTGMSDGMSPVIRETSFEKEYNKRGITSIEEMDKKFRLSESDPAEKEEEMSVEKDNSREEWLAKIDLRRAVVYSEILNRPYV
jgi:hypothetical protein